ncbi:AMP-binding enzyme [Raoultella sp. BIGb0138]|nr:AMP-binding enzyme [Raoultella sp. BIGb0138]
MHQPMMYQDLTTRALIEHAARYHRDTEIVSVATSGEKESSSWGQVAENARRLASAMTRLAIPAGARCGTLAWNNRRHPAIRSAAAIAARHRRWDERPVLLCVREEGGEIEEAELLAWYQERVPKWQLPDRILFIDSLPVSATGKVLKNRLRAEFGQILLGDGGEAG